MSLNSVSLSPSLLVALYQKTLVQGIASPVPFLGKNAKKILVVVDCSDVPFLPDGQLNFLTNVLSACGLGLSDVAVVNWRNRANNSAATVLSQTGAMKILLFGVNVSELDLPPTTPINTGYTQEERQYLVALPLTEIETNQVAKKEFWLALKQFFAL